MESLDKPKARGKPPTEAQKQARVRNFRVWRLRGLHSQLGLLTGDRRMVAMIAVDEELISMGADPESTRALNRALDLFIGDEK